MSDIGQLWEVQREQQALWHDLDNLTTAERELLVKDLLLHLHEETSELQRLMDRSRYHLIKRSMSDGSAARAALAESGVDVFKLLIALMLLGGVGPKQFLDEFLHKTEMVKVKWQWEQDAMADVEVLMCDVDGVIAKWSEAFLGYCEERGVVVEHGKLNAPHLEEFKDEFSQGGIFRQLAVYDGAVTVLNDWRERGEKRRLILVTARPFRRHRRLHNDTVSWCRDIGLHQDHILFEHDKAEAVRAIQPARIVAHIEDRGKHALEVAATGVRVLKFPYEAAEEQISHPNIVHVRDWTEVEAALKGLP